MCILSKNLLFVRNLSLWGSVISVQSKNCYSKGTYHFWESVISVLAKNYCSEGTQLKDHYLNTTHRFREGA